MSSTGLSKARLTRVRHLLSGHIERNDMPGLVALVSHEDDIHVETLGTLAFDNPTPMKRDTIFRIASITKLLTAVAAMILVEDCELRLDDAIERWLPELANRRVLTSIGSDLDDTVPAQRAITLRDLLTYSIGFGSVLAPPGTYPIQKAIHDYCIGGDRLTLPAETLNMDEWLRRLGSLPWMAQPGERWMYHVSADVLGALVARVSGKSFNAFLRERVFDPLGMKDTGFHVPPEKIGRLPALYARNPHTGKLDVHDSAVHSAWRAEPPMECGGGGMVSTIDDYFAFSRMLLNGGRSGNDRILSRATVQLMTSDRITPEQRKGSEVFFGAHSSWGFGMAVDIGRLEIYHSPGRFGWNGGTGTSAYIDPANGIIGILFTQRMMESPEPPKVFTDFWTMAYQAME